ncbi:MAG: hypothetical protein ACLPX9_13890 [Rhodomicrobium sp.]
MFKYLTVLLTAGAAIAGASAALAADKEDYCRGYSGAAMAAARDNIRWHCGYGGPRYTTNWEAHMGWCMSVDRAASERENEIRAHEMRDCNRH